MINIIKKMDQTVTNFINNNAAEQQLPVVIALNDQCNEVDLCQLCKLSSLDAVSYQLKEVKQITGKLCRHTLGQLQNHPDVNFIHYDYKVRANLNTATAAIGSREINNNFGLTGKGITISVIDSGIYRHYDLITPANRIVGFADFVNGQTVPYDDNGHGTHVAGAIAGNGTASSGTYRGVAPEANLVGVKVLDSQGNGSLSNVVAGIDWSIANRSKYGIRVINLSLGADPYTSYTNEPLAQACEKAWRTGIVVVAAAGNSGPSGTIDTPGFDPIILTVGAVNDRNTIPLTDDIPGDYTSSKPTVDGFIKPDIALPGTNITSLISPNSVLANQNPQNKVGNQYLTLTGTSMAAGVASGAVALLLQAYPPLTPDVIKVRMIEASRYFAPDFSGYSILTTLFNMTRHYNKI
ncbi:S8 family peptidase [Cytobacillus firmus]|uniref:S8 family peptidase n=1 Tax=Cytobacillus firmus TaxID=1399 RepID=UPI00207A8E11|nr:S8 family peptidase [Cytobacillus firmus]USK41245.1 S8 family peptidase [Cytobacillus firmus]